MRTKKESLLCIPLIAMLILGLGAALPIGYASPTTTLHVVNPLDGTDEFYFETGTTPALSTFTVRINFTGGVTYLYNWQVRVYWTDATLLNCTNAWLPSGHVFDGMSPIFSYNVDNATGFVQMGASVIPSMVGVVTADTGILGEFELQIQLPEPGYGACFECDLEFSEPYDEDTFLLYAEPPEYTTTGTITPVDYDNGHYEYCFSMPTELPYLEVVPNLYEASVLDEEVLLDIWLRNVMGGWRLVAVEFSLLFNYTILRAEGAINGTWLDGFGSGNVIYVEKHDFWDFYAPGMNYFKCGAMLMPPYSAPWPNGEGILFTLNFTAIYNTTWPDLYCEDLVFFDVLFLNFEMEEIGQGTHINGRYCAPQVIPFKRIIDVYICDYPAPHGGQGLNETADLVQPQQLVCLCAKVTYMGDPVQHKLVCFEIRSPDWDYIFVRFNYTDENGIAYICFRIPWPCDDPESIVFGIWTVVASVDIGEVTVKDWLWFKVNYKVVIDKVVAIGDIYKYQLNCWNISFWTYLEQPRWVLVTVVLYDDLDVPVAMTAAWFFIGGVPHSEWCEKLYYEWIVCLWIPKWTFLGEGKIYVNILTTWQWDCGHAITPEGSATFPILLP